MNAEEFGKAIDVSFDIRKRACTRVIREAQDRMMEARFIPKIMMWPPTRQSNIWYREWLRRHATS